MSQFQRYELAEQVKDAVVRLGYRVPTAVQENVIPLFFQGKNLMVEAPTGTGKTAAYGLPLISRLNLLKKSTQAIVILPTRELAIQVSEALQSFYTGTQLKVGKVIGGVPLEESYKEIKAAPHILVLSPGRLRDVLSQYEYPYIWRDVKHLVIDEGDKLMEPGFLREVDAIRKEIRNSAQVCFFSATISEDAEKMIRERVEHIHVIRLQPQQVLRNIGFYSIDVQKGQREQYLNGLLDQQNIHKALIFCSKREDIYGLSGSLRNQGFKAEAYHGTQEQSERENILRRFKEGHIDYLVASDLAARGLDIIDLPCVINFTVPKELDYYMHRVGRTGRAGNKGKVYNLLSGEIEKIELNRHHQYIRLPSVWLMVEPTAQRKVSEDDNKRVKIHISKGKSDKIRTADIVGFLIHEAGVEGNDIGTITLYTSYSIADVPLSVLENLQKKEEDGLILKGKAIKVRRFTLDEQENKAKSIKNLLQERKKPNRERYVPPAVEDKPEKVGKTPAAKKSNPSVKDSKPKPQGEKNKPAAKFPLDKKKVTPKDATTPKPFAGKPNHKKSGKRK